MGALIETQQLLLISHRTAVTVIGLLCWGGLNLGAIRTQFGRLLADSSSNGAQTSGPYY